MLQLDPRRVTDAYGLKISRLLFASLVTIDPQSLDVVPDLAERVTVVSPTVYRVLLREGLRFSDGSTLDADDVIATYRSVVDPSIHSPHARNYARLQSVIAITSRTVEFTLREAHATFLTDLELPIVRAEDASAVLGTKDGPATVSSGPYVLVRRTTGHLSLRANPHWYGGRPIHPDVSFVVVRDDVDLVVERDELAEHRVEVRVDASAGAEAVGGDHDPHPADPTRACLRRG